MKRQIRHIVVPLSLWETPDLSISEKHLLIDIDSICDSADGIAVGVQALASLSGMTQKEVKSTLNELYLKGAIDISVDADGAKKIKPFLYKDRYIKRGEKAVFGDKPTDTEALPYDDIMEQWNTICKTLPPLTRWTPQRKNKLRSALKNAALTVEDLYKCFRIVNDTPFLSGLSNQFKATFDWVTAKSQNLSKIYEGFYSKSFAEKQAYEAIMRGGDVAQTKNEDDYYR